MGSRGTPHSIWVTNKLLSNLIGYLKKNTIRIALGVGLTVVLCLNVLGLIHIQAIDRLENFSYDTRTRLTMPNTLDKRVVIVDIDEKSLKEQGRWPWNRKVLAGLVDNLLEEYHAKVIGFDMVFAESDESSGLGNLRSLGDRYLKDDAKFHEALNKVSPGLNYDQIFADHLRGRPVVLGFYFNQSNPPVEPMGQLPRPSLEGGMFDGLDIGFIKANSYGANLALLQKSARSAGHFNFLPDEDGILRKIPMLEDYNGAQYPSFSLAVAQEALMAESIDPDVVVDTTDTGSKKMYASVASIGVGKQRIPVDDTVSALIPFRGGRGSFAYVSATDVLNKRAARAVLDGAIVLVGTTAPGLMDLRATPIDSVYPGVEAHANMIVGILDGNVKRHPEYTPTLEIVALLVLGLILSLVLPKLNPASASAVSVGILVVVVVSNLVAWQHANLVLPLASLVVLVTSIFVLNMSYGFFYESRGKRQLAGIFGQYVPPELVGEMAKNPGNYTLESENRELTVLFSDVRGFTSISEGLSPKELSELMNEYLTPMTKIIHENRGTIDKYMGDAIMAFWGAPVQTNDHALLALRASMQMMERLDELKSTFVSKGWPPIDIGIGLNTGDMTVGNMGSSFRMAYTVMGDAVNLGSRLEGLTKEYGVPIIVSEFTKARVPEFVFCELDLVRVKGKDQPVAIFEPVGEVANVSESRLGELGTYGAALQLYRDQSWADAKKAFEKLRELSPARKLYGLYLERIRYYEENPPATDWDGAFTFKTK